MNASSRIFGRDCHTSLPTVVSGNGCYLIDQHGKQYLDASGGAAVSCLGHQHPQMKRALHEQLDKIAFAHTGFFTSEPAEQLAQMLQEKAPGMDWVYLVSGGSEAVEAALKLARQYMIEIGQPQRHHIIARRQSYHGNTLGALSAGGNMMRRETYAPMLMKGSHISPCFAFREQQPNETDQAYVARLVDELEQEILFVGPEHVLAFIAEPVVGATAGAVPALPGYFAAMREVCDRYGVLMILDEVMCGMGRTGSLFAYEQENITPDIVTIAKGLGAGYQPLGAMICTDVIYQAIKKGQGAFQHGHTYLGHPMAAAAGVAVLNIFEQENLVEAVQQKSRLLFTRLHQTFGQHPHVGDIRGRGLFLGLELVASRDDNQPFCPTRKLAKTIKQIALQHGLICYPSSGTIDGRYGDHILLAPPFVIQNDQLDELVTKLHKSLDEAIAKTG
ncbi:MAG: aspartate aminotransferase family protein [Alphaproteobacteria bacterium]